ncbi:diphosphomevalonate/mevalonate 3,5-bisphosphate decarboxylase family protein [Psychroserpens sp. XS_ASV72]|uniref:diphosphomevalonate/mevalonate 3,5-bisphosphate decarboxylase family protein n=1 Tax=Psychroserpens sp. XS_ASV72 TaxID=3241293 RepID=UPI00351950E0
MIAQDFIPKSYLNLPESGQHKWAAPSNIALVKYWGKKKDQIPENPSVSFTLKHCKTITSISYSKKKSSEGFSFDVFLDGEQKEDFKPKIETFFERIEVYLPFLKAYYFKIETSNTFPHSSGIASSASGMSALAMCLMSLERDIIVHSSKDGKTLDEDYLIKKASFLARLGSGSASRSIEGDLIVWGKHQDIEGSSDLFGVKYPYPVHGNFKNYQDTILLVDKGEKQVSSTVGHNLMHGHPFSERRFEQAHENMSKLKAVFESGDFDAFISIVESEALTLHAMMMTSMPYFILMKPNTLEIINAIWKFRENTNSKVCFTLDAGANVHVLYPEKEKENVLRFIKENLVVYCQNGHYISDEIGFGAQPL